MKLYRILAAVLIAAAIALCSCSGVENGRDGTATGEQAGNSGRIAPADTAGTVTDPTDDSKTSTGDFSITTSDGKYENDGSVYTITSAGTYTIAGSLSEGSVVISAGENDDVTVVLNGVSLSSTADSPLMAVSAGDVKIEAADGTYNVINDGRTGSPEVTEGDENIDAAIYASCDLKLAGHGTVIVTSSYDNGVKSKDDLKIKSLSLKVTAPGNALKGNDSVTVESGSIILISTGSDGVKTSNTGVSSKGKQQGTVSLLGGQIDVYSKCDGISAAYNAEISGDCILNVFTSTYATDAASSGGTELYLIVPSGIYSASDGYYAYLYNDDETAGIWLKCEFETMVRSGRSSYYGLRTDLPAGYENILFNIVPGGKAPDGSNYTASSGGGAVNRQMNGFLIQSVSGETVTGDWVQLSSGSGGADKTTYSSKGIKAYNEIIVSGGTTTVYAKDDGLHANADGKLESGETAAGAITVSNGRITVTCADDGMHADGRLTITGGEITIVESHEGLEGNVITITGGTTFVYGGDDGLNATKTGSSAALINITGGYLDVTTPSGDTDAIDSNGSFTMSGGFVIVKGGSSSGMVAGSVDVDGSVTVTGGTIIALGGICETPSGKSVNTYISNGTAFQAGDYTLADSDGNKVATFTLKSSYTSCWIASDALELNGSYNLSAGGSQILSWTQTSATVGSAGGGFGGGGFGGFGGRGGRR